MELYKEETWVMSLEGITIFGETINCLRNYQVLPIFADARFTKDLLVKLVQRTSVTIVTNKHSRHMVVVGANHILGISITEDVPAGTESAFSRCER